jgi:hypothetical protein
MNGLRRGSSLMGRKSFLAFFASINASIKWWAGETPFPQLFYSDSLREICLR